MIWSNMTMQQIATEVRKEFRSLQVQGRSEDICWLCATAYAISLAGKGGTVSWEPPKTSVPSPEGMLR